MNNVKKISLITELIDKTEQLAYRDGDTLNAIRQEAEMIIKMIFGEGSSYRDSLNSANFYPMVAPVEEEFKRKTWNSGQRSLINTFNTMKREIELSSEIVEENGEIPKDEMKTDELFDKVFLVHGHDESMKQAVARTTERLGLNAIILGEQDDEGLTVIEKFEKYATECNYAVVLLSPDDIGYSRKEEQQTNNYRARQNVILELGYFIGKLGRSNVLTLVKDDPSGPLELPSDIAGVLYTQFDSNGGWKLKLVRGLKSNGYQVSADDL